MKQRVLVLGGSGFIGQRVVQALAAGDWATPVAASRRPVADQSAGRCESVQVDATDARQLQHAMDGVAGVVNCVLGNSHTILSSAHALFGVLAAMPHPPRTVHLSSLAVYGAAVGDVGESTPPREPLSAYGRAKLESERLVTDGLPVVILRPGIVYGPRGAQWSGRMAQLLRARRLGDLGPAGDGYCNLSYIDDTVEAIVRALRLPDIQGRIFNIAIPDPPTWNEFLIRYAIALGAVPVTRISGRRLRVESKLLAAPLKVAEIVARRMAPRRAHLLPQAIPPSLIRLFQQEIRMQVSLAEELLGLRWTSVEKGLSQAADWYRASVMRRPEPRPAR